MLKHLETIPDWLEEHVESTLITCVSGCFTTVFVACFPRNPTLLGGSSHLGGFYLTLTKH